MKFPVYAATAVLSLVLGACRAGAPLAPVHGPVGDGVMRKLNERSLGEAEFNQALLQTSMKPSRAVPAREVRLPFRMVNGVPQVHCQINGRRPVPMIFDTGASHTMLNVRDALKLKVMTLSAASGAVPMVGVMGVEQGRFGMVETLELGDWRIRAYPCLVRTQQNGIQGSRESRFFQPNLLGFDLAQQSASFLTVDYQRQEITYGFGEPLVPPTGAGVASAPMQLVSGVPFTRMSIGAHHWDALIDTGSFNGIEIGAAFAKRLGIHARSKPVEGLAVFGVGGTMSAADAGLRVTTVPEVRGCGLVQHAVLVAIAPGTPRIGSLFLKDYRVTFDLRRNKLWLERSSGAFPRDTISTRQPAR